MASNTLTLRAIDYGPSMTTLVYQALKQGIMDMNIYDREADLRLDERQLAEDLGVSRTPIREAIVRLEHEGLVRTVPRRGTFVVRKTKKEILEIITVWAALEGMAAALQSDERYEAALLDSIHTEEHVWAEFQLAAQLVCSCGLILIHDFRYALGTVEQALIRIEAEGYNVSRLWAAESGVAEDDHLGLALIVNSRRIGSEDKS